MWRLPTSVYNAICHLITRQVAEAVIVGKRILKTWGCPFKLECGMGEYTKWSCGVCSAKIRRDEIFTFSSKGAVHFRCLREEALKSVGLSVPEARAMALLDLLEAELNLIVAYKRAMSTVAEEEAKLLGQLERDAEKHAALVTKMVDQLVAKG